MYELKIRGGARVGMMNATWPFATLKVSDNKLELNVSMIGDYVFQPGDIISLIPYTMIPVFGQGIEIKHRVMGYNAKIIFWTFENPRTLIEQIYQTGFLSHIDSKLIETDQDIINRQNSAGFPLKIAPVVTIVIVWNALFLSDILGFWSSKKKNIPLGTGSDIALAIVFTISVLLLLSKNFSKIFLKEGRTVKDISKFLYLLLFITGVMLITRIFIP